VVGMLYCGTCTDIDDGDDDDDCECITELGIY
jgi:hypothetical protein